MKGLQIDYKINNGMSSRFNQKMFGRLSSRTTNGKKYIYYIPGVLDEIPHFRLFEGRIFTADMDIDFNPIFKYVNSFNVSSVCKDDNEILMMTGKHRWRFYAREKDINVEGM